MAITHGQTMLHRGGLRTGMELDASSLRDMVAQIPAAMAILGGPDHHFTQVNELFVDATGRAEARDFLGMPVREAFPELEAGGAFESLDEVYRTGMTYRGRELKITLPQRATGNGPERYFDFTFQPVLDSAGRAEGILVLVVDVTERVAGHQALEEREARFRLAQRAAQIGQPVSEREEEFRSLAESMPQLVWMSGPDGYIHWFNQRWYDYTGTTPEQNCGWGWQSAHDPKFLPEVVSRWKGSLQSGEPFEMVFPLRGKEGKYKPFLTRAVPIRDAGGAITQWFGTNTDISSEFEIRRQIEESQVKLQTALDASQRLAAIVESSDDAIIGKDLNGIVTSWNPAAERMFGYPPEEMVGTSIRKVIPQDVFPDEDRIMSAVAHGQRTEHFETTRLRKDGERIQISLTLSPVFDETGRIVGVASISRDISQQEKVEKALHTSERLASVGRLAATIAHEINNPLEAVTNLVFLAQSCSGEADKKMFLEQAQQELARVALLTKQTLGFYRENRGAREMTLGELVAPLVSVFSARARNKQISIDTDIREDPVLAMIPGEIRQLFANLLNNSIDAVSEQGRIMIRISAAREQRGHGRKGARLTVCDNGPGIPPQVRKKLFEPFFTTKRDVGTGLGLWVTSNILRRHEGSIRLRSSVTPGKSWTAFSVFLPAGVEVEAVGN